MQPTPHRTRRTLWFVSPPVLVLALIVISLLSGLHSPLAVSRSGSTKSAAQGMTLTVAPTHPGTKFALGPVGLSIEPEELTSRDLNIHQAPVALMRLLGPGVLRIGGNSVDRSWWTSNGERPPAWAGSVITPANLVSLRDLLIATDWRAILGVNFGHFDPTRAADEVRIAQSILGSRLLGIQIGNEPHGYSTPSIHLRGATYSASTYL